MHLAAASLIMMSASFPSLPLEKSGVFLYIDVPAFHEIVAAI